MRCLHILSGDLWAGAEVSAFHMITELARRQGITVAAIVLNPGTLATRLEGCGVPTTVMDESEISFPRQAIRCVRYVARWKPQIIHSHRYKENLLGALAAGTSGALHVRSAHGLPPQLDWNGRIHGMGALLDETMADWSGSTWIAVSHDLARRISGMRRSVHVVPNGLPEEPPVPDRETLDRAFDGPPGALHVGFVGRLEDVKRPDRFLRILSLVPEKVGGRSVRGIVVGDGSLKQRMIDLARDLGLTDRVRFLGHRADADSLLAALDLLLVPSDHEGHPMVLLQAMRSGVPVVATRVGGIPETLGPAAWVIPPAREAEMARAVARLLGEPEARKAWIGQLRERFLARYTVGRTVDGLLAAYVGPKGAA